MGTIYNGVVIKSVLFIRCLLNRQYELFINNRSMRINILLFLFLHVTIARTITITRRKPMPPII